MDRDRRRPVRLLQTSDVHLGDRSNEPGGRAHAHECTCPVDVMLHLVDEHDVDVLLIVGDLFDHARVSDDLVHRTFERLAEADAEVVLLPGNHDQHDARAVYRRRRDAVDVAGVRFFDDHEGAEIDLLDGALRLWARSMVDHHPGFRPFVGAPQHPGDRWYVAAGHGHFVSTPDDMHRSSPVRREDIDAIGADYVALGHWHVMTDLATRGVSTPAWYSGAPLFGHGAGRMLLVDLHPDDGVAVTPLDVLAHPASRC